EPHTNPVRERREEETHVTLDEIEQSRGTDGTLEGESLEDRGRRLARVLRRCPDGRADDRNEADRSERRERGPVPPRRSHPARRRLPGRPADGDRSRPEKDAQRERPGVPGGRERRRRDGRVEDDDQEPPLAVRRGSWR